MLPHALCLLKVVREVKPVSAENRSCLRACWRAFVSSHTGQFNFHKQLGSAAITWEFIFPSICASPTLGGHGIRAQRILSPLKRMYFANLVLPSKERQMRVSVHNYKCIQ